MRMNMSYLGLNDIKVKVTLGGKEPMLARATVIFFEAIETHGWRVMTSEHEHPQFGEYLWIQAPSFKTFKNWKEIVYIPDKKTWEMVNECIYDAFCMARSKKTGIEGMEKAEKPKDISAGEEVNPDDIPF
jgi:hypothetical protein